MQIITPNFMLSFFKLSFNKISGVKLFPIVQDDIPTPQVSKSFIKGKCSMYGNRSAKGVNRILSYICGSVLVFG
jgi:hypothetical protein